MVISNFLQHASWAGLATLLVLILCSVYIVALGRDLHLRLNQVTLNPYWLLAQARYLLFTAKLSPTQIRSFLSAYPQPLANVYGELLLLKHPTLESGDYLLSSLFAREQDRLEAGLASLGTIAVIAPFIGLFGTVVGITKTFADVARLGKTGIEVVSSGVSEALVTTAVGLIVAITSVILFNTFKARISRVVSSWDSSARTLLSLLTSPPDEASERFQPYLHSETTETAQAFAAALSTPSTNSP